MFSRIFPHKARTPLHEKFTYSRPALANTRPLSTNESGRCRRPGSHRPLYFYSLMIDTTICSSTQSTIRRSWGFTSSRISVFATAVSTVR